MLEYLHAFNLTSVMFRLALAMFCGGMIGLDRGRKHRPAGFRTYMLVSLGASLTVLLSQYESTMLTTQWADIAAEIGLRTDVSRFAAQVINGIGFLGAGTILVTGRQQVKGLNTAAGLWASACMGIAVGAGFYSCVCIAFILMLLCFRIFPAVDHFIQENARDMNLYIEFESLSHLGDIISRIKQTRAQIYEVDITRGEENGSQMPSAVFSIRIQYRRTHTQIMSSIAELDCIYLIEEI